MPSYDKEKLLRMMQERRVGFLNSRDLSQRLNDLRTQISRMSQTMRINAQSVDASDFMEELLALPLEEAMARPAEQVERFLRTWNTRSEAVQHERLSGISYSTWCEFNQLRSRFERIQVEQRRHEALMNERYAILLKLKDAVIDWGFNNPDDEM